MKNTLLFKRAALALALLLCLAAAGCMNIYVTNGDGSTPSPTVPLTAEPQGNTESPDPAETPAVAVNAAIDRASTYVDFLDGLEFEADLNGDGFAEKIKITECRVDDYYDDSCLQLSVTGADGTEHSMYMAMDTALLAVAYDMDADGLTELFISGRDSEYWHQTYILRFTGEGLILAAPEYFYEYYMPRPDPYSVSKPCFYGSIAAVNENSLTVDGLTELLGTRIGRTAYIMDENEFRFAPDPSMPWIYDNEIDGTYDDYEEYWEYTALETAAEFPVLMDGDNEHTALPVGTRLLIREMQRHGDEGDYIFRFITEAGDEGYFIATQASEYDRSCSIDGIPESVCFANIYGGD